MTKVLILTSEKRVLKYTDFTKIPENWELEYVDYGYTDGDVLSAGKDADFILADAVNPVSGHVIGNMPNLRLIHSEGVAYNLIDSAAAAKRGVFVCNNAALNSGAVAEQAVLLILALLRRLTEGDSMVRTGNQAKAKASFILNGITELYSCRTGIIGFGSIGRETALRLSAFGSKVFYYSRHRSSPQEESNYHAQYLPLDELISSCDIISLHLPVTPSTVNFVDEKFLHGMKRTAYLINTARGEIVNQEALAKALIDGTIAGAGLDTLYPEPVTLNNPLLNLPPEVKYKVVFSPHIGGTTNGVFFDMYRNIWSNITAVSEGKRPCNIVNGI